MIKISKFHEEGTLKDLINSSVIAKKLIKLKYLILNNLNSFNIF